MKQTCYHCRHWNPDGERVKDSPGVGICEKMEHLNKEYDPISGQTVFKNRDWKAGCIDGSDYFAAVITRHDFGCNLWEAKETP